MRFIQQENRFCSRYIADLGYAKSWTEKSTTTPTLGLIMWREKSVKMMGFSGCLGLDDDDHHHHHRDRD